MAGHGTMEARFLPARYQGTAIGRASQPAKEFSFKNIQSLRDEPSRRQQFELLQKINEAQLREGNANLEMEAVIQSYELAWRMQNNAPGIVDISKETQATLDQYGIGEKND